MKAQCPPTYGIDWAAVERQQLETIKREDAEYKARIEKLEKELGVKLGPPGVNPVPIEKPVIHLSAKIDDAKEAQENVGLETDVHAIGEGQGEPDAGSSK